MFCDFLSCDYPAGSGETVQTTSRPSSSPEIVPRNGICSPLDTLVYIGVSYATVRACSERPLTRVLATYHSKRFQTTKSGLVIPEKAQEKVNEATVIAVGSGGRSKVSGMVVSWRLMSFECMCLGR